ncbi:MAG: hypothetical protein ABIJ28_03265, partial [Patescibacteria group bacterium]
MPKHKPIKFETVLEPNLKRKIERIIKENPKAKTALNATIALIAVGGILTTGPAALGLMREITRMKKDQKKRNFEEYRLIWQRFHILKNQRALKFIKEENNQLIYTITEKGKEK